MTKEELKIKKAEKKLYKMLTKLYNKGYLSSYGFESNTYHYSFRCSVKPPKRSKKW